MQLAHSPRIENVEAKKSTGKQIIIMRMIPRVISYGPALLACSMEKPAKT